MMTKKRKKSNSDLIFIEGNIPSSKNSKRWTGKKIISSKTVLKYLKNYTIFWKVKKGHFLSLSKNLEYPYHIGFNFVRGTAHRYDFINMCQICQDLMVKCEWIEDDDTKHMYAHPFKVDGKYESYNKEKPGVYIKIFKDYEL